MAERMLITKVKRTTATRCELFGARHQYADLHLFDLSELAAVGLDPATLALGEETPARFWAIYELSEKLNKAGNPYKDIVALEAIDTPATTTSAAVGDSEILAELRAIRALLGAIADRLGTVGEPAPQLEPAELDEAFPRYLDGQAVGDNAAELQAYQQHVAATGSTPANLDALRAWVRAARKSNGGH